MRWHYGKASKPRTDAEARGYRDLARAIRDERLMQDIAPAELAEACGVNKRTIYNIEEGRRLPSLALVFRIASALGVSASELVQ